MLRWRSSVQQLRIFLVLLSIIPGEIVLYGSMFKSPRQRHSSRAAVLSVAARASTVRRKPKRKRNSRNRGRANPKRIRGRQIAFTQVSNAPPSFSLFSCVTNTVPHAQESSAVSGRAAARVKPWKQRGRGRGL